MHTSIRHLRMPKISQLLSVLSIVLGTGPQVLFGPVCSCPVWSSSNSSCCWELAVVGDGKLPQFVNLPISSNIFLSVLPPRHRLKSPCGGLAYRFSKEVKNKVRCLRTKEGRQDIFEILLSSTQMIWTGLQWNGATLEIVGALTQLGFHSKDGSLSLVLVLAVQEIP